jgi:hypothetical protein
MATKYDTNTTADEFVKDFASEIKKTKPSSPRRRTRRSRRRIRGIHRQRPTFPSDYHRAYCRKGPKDSRYHYHPKSQRQNPNSQARPGSLAAVREAAEIVNSWADVPHIDVLVNNAGLMATPYSLTKDGFESQFGTNHLGHFLFTHLIMDKILASKSPRAVNITSDGHHLNPTRRFEYKFSISSSCQIHN